MNIASKLARHVAGTNERIHSQPPLRVHFENLPSKPPVFHITEDKLDSAKKRYPDVVKHLFISRGEDIASLCELLPEIQVLVTSYDVLSNPIFPLHKLAHAATNCNGFY